MRTAHLFAILLLAPALLTLVPPAEAVGSTALAGCARITHYQTGAPLTAAYFRVSTDTLDATSACAATSATYIEPVCSTLNVKYLRNGASAPSDPNRWHIYIVDEGGALIGFTPGAQTDHSSAGTTNWAYNGPSGTAYTSDPNASPPSGTSPDFVFRTNPDGATITFCPDHGGLYRIVLRMCQLTLNQVQHACGTAATNYDVNSDENPTCACSGQDAGALYSADGNPADLAVQWNPELRDPLTVSVAEKKVGYLAYEPVNVTIDARYLNGTLRSGGASNITLHFEAPDHTWPVDGVNPTEMKFSDGTGMGRYYYTFTPTQTGTYQITARTISSLNERMVSKPFDLEVLAVGARPLTRDDLNLTNTYANASLTALPALLNNLNAYLAALQNTTTAPLARTTHLENVNDYLSDELNDTEAAIISAAATLTNNAANYLALLQNSTTGPLMRSVHGENVNAYLSALLNSTTTPLARSAHLENVNGYIAIRQNATTDPLARDATLTYFGTGIYALSNLSLTADEFRAWNVGEFRPGGLVLNGTAREASLVYYGGGIFGVANLTLSAEEFRSWKVGEFRPTSAIVNLTLPTTTFLAWRDGEWRHAWATINGTDGNVTSANNTASGALNQSYFNTWRDGEFRPMSGVVNDTLNVTEFEGWRNAESRVAWSTLNATRTELAIGFGDIERLELRTTAQILADGNLTRSYLPAHMAHRAWESFDQWWTPHKPASSDLALVLLAGLCFALWGIWAPKAKRLARLKWVVAGLALLGAYGYASGLAGMLPIAALSLP